MKKKNFYGLLIFSATFVAACASDGKVAQPPTPTTSNAPRSSAMSDNTGQKITPSTPKKRPEWTDNVSAIPKDDNEYFIGRSHSFPSEASSHEYAYHDALTMAASVVDVGVDNQYVKQMISNQRVGEIVNPKVNENTTISQAVAAVITGAHETGWYGERTADGNLDYWVLVQIPKKNIEEARVNKDRKSQEIKYGAKLKDIKEMAAKAGQTDMRLLERINLWGETISAVKGIDFSNLPGENKDGYLTRFGDQKKRLEDELSHRNKTSVIVVTGRPSKMDASAAEKLSDKVVENLEARLPHATRMLTKCDHLEACMKEAENEDYGRLVALRTDTGTKSGAMGGITATIMIEVTVYEVNSRSVSPPVTASAQVIAWDGDTIPWEIALDKALKNEKLAALVDQFQREAGK
jgi:hypothetical protein